MTEHKVTLAGALPKDSDANGFAAFDLAEELFRTRAERRTEEPRVALIVYGIRNADLGKDGVNTTKIEPLWAEPVRTISGRRAAQKILTDEYAVRTGEAMLPHALSVLVKAAFASLPRTTDEIDAEEAAEQDLMSPTDELRRHLERVHGVEGSHLLTAEEADERHRADHDGDTLGPLAHDPEWRGWTRADLEAAAAEGAENDDAWQADESEPAETNVVRAEHSMQADADQDDHHRMTVIGNADDRLAAARRLDAEDSLFRDGA
jgi:hypothetical protein